VPLRSGRASRAGGSFLACATMLRLDTGTVTSDKIRNLGGEVHHLREAIVQYLARIPY